MLDLASTLAGHAATFALAACRLAGFVAVSPWPGPDAPVKQRVGLVVVLAWVVAGATPNVATRLDLALVGSASVELLCGALMAGVLRFALVAADLVGAAFSHATGLGVPSVLNPHLESHDTVGGRIASLMGMLLLVTVGAHRVALAYLIESFHAVPVATPMSVAAGAAVLVDQLAGAMLLGVRLAAPLAAMALVIQISLAIVARSAPSLQLFNAGLTVMLASGMLVLLGTLGDVGGGLAESFASTSTRLDAVLAALGARAP